MASYMEQFESYSSEVNRQISSISEVLNEIQIQNAQLVNESRNLSQPDEEPEGELTVDQLLAIRMQ